MLELGLIAVQSLQPLELLKHLQALRQLDRPDELPLTDILSRVLIDTTAHELALGNIRDPR
jgi:hypothetical protein